MVTLVFLCRRRPDISHDDYAERVLVGHVPLALRHHPTMRGYVVNLVEEPLADAPAIDSVAVLRFDSFEDYRDRLYDSPAGEAIIGRDVVRFMGGADAYVTTTTVQRAGPAPVLGQRSAGRKLVCALARPGCVDGAAFQGEVCREVVPRLVGESAGVAHAATNVVDRSLGDGARWDVFVEVGLDDGVPVAPLREALAAHAGASATWVVAEHVQRVP